jgi:hypothetical protein
MKEWAREWIKGINERRVKERWNKIDGIFKKRINEINV